MNAVARQIQKTVTSPRRFGVVSVAVFLGLVLYIAMTLPVVRHAASVVQYEDTNENWVTIEPVDSVLCPGETMAYSVTVTVVNAPAVVDLYEAWCVAKRQCPKEFKLPIDYSIASEPGELGTFDAQRVVPNLPPGEWEFRHANITKVNESLASLSGYSLFITVPNDCAQ